MGDFYPTYKKFESREPIDMNQPNWPELTYRVQHKQPFYKGGSIKERVPSWCDRILTYTHQDTLSKLIPHSIHDYHNYRSINTGVGMDISDHSPVTCTFRFIHTCLPPKTEKVKEK